MTIHEYLNLIASYGGLGLIFYGIRVMAKGAEMRSADSERKHTETMSESDRKHTEAMAVPARTHRRTGGKPHGPARTHRANQIVKSSL